MKSYLSLGAFLITSTLLVGVAAVSAQPAPGGAAAPAAAGRAGGRGAAGPLGGPVGTINAATATLLNMRLRYTAFVTTVVMFSVVSSPVLFPVNSSNL